LEAEKGRLPPILPKRRFPRMGDDRRADIGD
jgi:hypothetical protein